MVNSFLEIENVLDSDNHRLLRAASPTGKLSNGCSLEDRKDSAVTETAKSEGLGREV